MEIWDPKASRSQNTATESQPATATIKVYQYDSVDGGKGQRLSDLQLTEGRPPQRVPSSGTANLWLENEEEPTKGFSVCGSTLLKIIGETVWHGYFASDNGRESDVFVKGDELGSATVPRANEPQSAD